MILLIDHYDSFVYNLARYLNRLGQQTSVVRFDEVELDQIQASTVDAIVLSPGPCAPQQAQPSMDLVLLPAARFNIPPEPYRGDSAGQMAS